MQSERFKVHAKKAWSQFLAYARTPGPPPPLEARVDRVLYGLAQPVFGLRLLVRHRDLLRAALIPAALLAGFCLFVAFARAGFDPTNPKDVIKTFYLTFSALAPVPSILFARHYARLACRARIHLGFGPCEPRLERLRHSVGRAIKQGIMTGIAPLPFVLLVQIAVFLLGFDTHLAQAMVLAPWVLHWIVVEAWDDARVLAPGQTLEQADALGEQGRTPWFVRALRAVPVLGKKRRGREGSWAKHCDKYSKEWRHEIATIEDHRFIAIGFALATAALLAIPLLNLLFRPIILVASAHLLGQLEASARQTEALAEPATRSALPVQVTA